MGCEDELRRGPHRRIKVDCVGLSIRRFLVQERIQMRILIADKETLRTGRSKVVAEVVDKANKLQSVLVLTAWNDDINRLQQHIESTASGNCDHHTCEHREQRKIV